MWMNVKVMIIIPTLPMSSPKTKKVKFADSPLWMLYYNIRTIIFFQGTQSWLKLQLSRSFNPIYCAQLLVPILNKTIVGQISSFSPFLPQQQLFSFPLIIFAFASDYLFALLYALCSDYPCKPEYCVFHKYCIPEKEFPHQYVVIKCLVCHENRLA